MMRNSTTPSIAAAIAAALVLFTAPTASAQRPETPIEPSLFSGLHYRNIGPSQGGRVTAVTGVSARPGVFYMGATGGGVWKTDNYGQKWENVSDGFFATGSIGAIRTTLSNPDIVYVGTGSDGIRSNVIQGRGVYKSTDAGKSWQLVGLRAVGQIGAVEIHPTNPDVVFVAAVGQPFAPNAERGVYRTRDGGATWEQVLSISDSTGAVDLEFTPDNPDEVYASMWRAERKPWTIISGAYEGGVYKSTDGGTTWSKLEGGLPTGLVGKSDLAVSAADPNRLYVLIEAAVGGGLYRSDDRGGSFRLVSTQSGILDRPFYYTNVDADPTNADVVYVSATRFWRSKDGGRTFERRSTPHGDNHDIWIDPANPQVMIQSNDGGANVTRDGGETWSSQDNQPTAELYQVAVDDRFPYWAYAGQQDNGTAIAVPSLPPYSMVEGTTGFMREVGGCETGPAVPKPGDPNIVYTNCKGQFARFDQRTGQERAYWVGGQYLYGHNPKDLIYRFQRVSPIHVSPHDPNTVYHGSQYVHRTQDDGVTWERISDDLTAFDPDKQVVPGTPITRDVTGEEYYSTLYAIRESPLERGLIWVGANDGPVHVTRDAGRTWRDVTPKALPPGGRVQNIEPSPHRPGKAYVAVYRYLLGDFQPYIYRTVDYGRTWTRLTTGSNGIPDDYPTRVVREDPDREGLLYAGTEFGMFISFDDGVSWQPFQLNLPVTPVTDIAIHQKDLVISTMGRSFWVLDDVSRVHQLTGSETVPRLYAPRLAYRTRRGSGGYRGGEGSGHLEYAPPGGTIDYFLVEGTGEVTLEILNSSGVRVRRLSSAPKTPGMHRVRWDFTVDASSTGAREGGGPPAVPGRYAVRLTVGGQSQTQPLEVVLDPRLTADGLTTADLQEQFDLAVKVRTLMTDVQGTLARVRRLTNRPDLDENAKTRLNEAFVGLTAADGPYPMPKLVEQVAYLNRLVNRADQKPGRDAHERHATLAREHAEMLKTLEGVPGWSTSPGGADG